jgi:dTDP-4-dehydrorhamnose 3,5-epimerase
MSDEAQRDPQTVTGDGRDAGAARIDGVQLREARNVLTRSGTLLEVFRADWPEVAIAPAQVNWVMLWPGGVTDWHRHELQTDHLFVVSGNIKLCLYDDRPGSPTAGVANTFRVGELRPTLVIVPPGVWHGLRNETGERAGYVNYFDHLYVHEEPDNWRLPHDTPAIPCRL